MTLRDEAERQELESRALNEKRHGDFDTHPSLSNRLAALPDGQTPAPSGGPALALLKEPEELAVRLLTEIERIANEEELRDSAQIRQGVRKHYRSRKHTPAQLGGAVLIVIGIVFGLMSLAALGEAGTVIDWSLFALLACVAMVGLGIWMYRAFPFRERVVLPVPAWTVWRATMDGEARQAATKCSSSRSRGKCVGGCRPGSAEKWRGPASGGRSATGTSRGATTIAPTWRRNGAFRPTRRVSKGRSGWGSRRPTSARERPPSGCWGGPSRRTAWGAR
jgi:hypothetical protein